MDHTTRWHCQKSELTCKVRRDGIQVQNKRHAYTEDIVKESRVKRRPCRGSKVIGKHRESVLLKGKVEVKEEVTTENDS